MLLEPHIWLLRWLPHGWGWNPDRGGAWGAGRHLQNCHEGCGAGRGLCSGMPWGCGSRGAEVPRGGDGTQKLQFRLLAQGCFPNVGILGVPKYSVLVPQVLLVLGMEGTEGLGLGSSKLFPSGPSCRPAGPSAVGWAGLAQFPWVPSARICAK